jgi:hypothetical protein
MIFSESRFSLFSDTSARAGPYTAAESSAKPSSSPPSPSPIAPFAQQRSSFAQLPRVSVSHESGQPSPLSELLPIALVGQPRSAHELTWTAFRCRSPFCMFYRMLRARHRCDEVPWSTDLVPSLTDEPLPLDWTLSSSFGAGLYQVPWRL